MIAAAAGASEPIFVIGTKILQKLTPHLSKFAGVSETVAEEAVGNAAATAADGGQAASVFNGRRFLTDLDLLDELSEFQTHLSSLNGQVDHKQKALIDQIISSLRTGDGEISAPQVRELYKTVFDITCGGGVDESSKQRNNGSEDKRTDGASKGEQAKSTQADDLFDPIKRILRRELIDKSSLAGFAAEIAKQTGFGSIEDNVDGFIDKYLLTDEFKGALRKSILGEEVDTQGFNSLQDKAFKVASWSLWGIDKLPEWSIQYFPLITTVIKFSMPIWTHIPFLRKSLGTLYPVIDEVAKFIGKFQDETRAIKDAMGKMRGNTQTQEPTAPTPEAKNK